MGLIIDYPIYHKGKLSAHIVAEARQDPPLRSYVEIDLGQQLSYGMLERVPNVA
jgi:hypothetical protein